MIPATRMGVLVADLTRYRVFSVSRRWGQSFGSWSVRMRFRPAPVSRRVTTGFITPAETPTDVMSL